MTNIISKLKKIYFEDREKLHYFLVRRPYYLLKKTPLFNHIMIQTNYSCTRDCSFCHYGQEKKPKPETMSMELIEKLFGELSDINYKGRLSLYEINEPLTDKRIYNLVKMAKAAVPSAFQTLFTNGDLLTERKGIELFECGLSLLQVNSYDKKILKNNQSIADKLRKRGYLVLHKDQNEQNSWSGRAGNVKNYTYGIKKNSCERVFVQMYVKPSGIVPSCVNDFYDINIMGNANHNTLQEIWFGEEFEKLRRKLIFNNRAYSKLCINCDYIGYGGFFNFEKFRKS